MLLIKLIFAIYLFSSVKIIQYNAYYTIMLCNILFDALRAVYLHLIFMEFFLFLLKRHILDSKRMEEITVEFSTMLYLSWINDPDGIKTCSKLRICKYMSDI